MRLAMRKKQVTGNEQQEHKHGKRTQAKAPTQTKRTRRDPRQWVEHEQQNRPDAVASPPAEPSGKPSPQKNRSACQKQGQSLGHAHTGERRARSRCRNSEADTQTQGGSVARYASRFGLRESTSAAAVVENENNPTPKRGVALEHDQAHEHERRHKQGRRQASRQQMVHGHEGRS